MTPAQEHRAKYLALALQLGFDDLIQLVPATPESIRAALGAGDEHLNTIPLVSWDQAALLGAPGPIACPTCGRMGPNPIYANDWPQSRLGVSARLLPWSRVPSLSLAERVCVLKEVARQIAERSTTANPPEETT